MAKKIPTALVRNPEDRSKVLLEITPGCEWVFAGEGVPTRKWNGTCVMFDGTDWWARREVKPGKGEPEGYIVVDYDEVTGKTQGWEPIEQSSFAKFHEMALENVPDYHGRFLEGTYELVGPKIQGNTDGFVKYTLLPHASAPIVPDLNIKVSPSTVAHILPKLAIVADYEGVVWHHPDGRMAKLKARDF